MLCFLLSLNEVRAEEPEKTESGETNKTSLVQKAKQKIAATAEDDYEKFRVGGYGRQRQPQDAPQHHLHPPLCAGL